MKFLTLLLILCIATTIFADTIESPLKQSSVTDAVSDDPNFLKSIQEKGQKYVFQAEINQLLGIIINSLYTEKEIFLRELISNASDALDKIRFISLTDTKALASNENLEIRIRPNAKENTLTLIDSGIGMTRQELENNLGTIAKSGTKSFLEKLKTTSDYSLIGQFGVGFYSAFMVADRVTVISKSNDDDQHIWSSEADNSFTIIKDPRGNTLGRGSEIILHLKPDIGKEYLKEEVLRKLVDKYSEFTHFPIYLYTTKTVEEDKKEEKKDVEGDKKEEDVEVKTEKKPEKVTKTVNDWEVLNENKPIWTRDIKTITQDEYNKFYKAFARDPDDPITNMHFSSEGTAGFKSLLFVPSKQNSQMQADFTKDNQNIRLYVRRIFITDNIKEFLPRYLNFVKGLVDSEDLPLHISRQDLQTSSVLKVIKRRVLTKSIAMFERLADDKEKYKTFWKEYGKNIRLGILDDTTNRKKLIDLCRWQSTKSGENLISLKDYVASMKEKQKHIYYITGESIEAIKKSPLLEELEARDLEVLYFVDPIDEYTLQHLTEYDGKPLSSVTREGLEFGDEEEKKAQFEEDKKNFEPLTKFIKKVFPEDLMNAQLSQRLNKSPCIIVAPKYGFTANMERIIKAQALGGDNPYASMMKGPNKIMEINPLHPVIIDLNERLKANDEDPDAKGAVELLYQTASLRSGYPVKDQEDFADRIFGLMSKGIIYTETTAAPKEAKAEAKEPKDEL